MGGGGDVQAEFEDNNPQTLLIQGSDSLASL